MQEVIFTQVQVQGRREVLVQVLFRFRVPVRVQARVQVRVPVQDQVPVQVHVIFKFNSSSVLGTMARTSDMQKDCWVSGTGSHWVSVKTIVIGSLWRPVARSLGRPRFATKSKYSQLHPQPQLQVLYTLGWRPRSSSRVHVLVQLKFKFKRPPDTYAHPLSSAQPTLPEAKDGGSGLARLRLCLTKTPLGWSWRVFDQDPVGLVLACSIAVWK